MGNSPEAQIGARIRSLRKRAGLSISQLAGLAELDVSFVNHLELGKRNPTLGTLLKIVGALDIRLEDLFRSIASTKNDVDYQVVQQARALLRGKKAADKSDILAILKRLRDREGVAALKHLIRR